MSEKIKLKYSCRLRTFFNFKAVRKSLNSNQIKKIYITASGGPFLNYKIKRLKLIKPKDALKHPKWKMGKKLQSTLQL